jgi:tRNA (guanine-N1)-methyltransferase
MTNLEHPQYTRPEEIYGYSIPNILLTGDEKAIKKRQENESSAL